MAVIKLYKPIGVTPGELVEKFKSENPKYKNARIAFAGRLDPLARGKMILLTGKDRFEAKKYQNLDKIYEFKVLLGFSTDSYDLLGIPKAHKINVNDVDIKITKFVKKYKGKTEQKYPPFSAKTVEGKKLFWWARNNRLDEIVIPTKNIFIYNLEYLSSRKVKKSSLIDEIIRKINKVKGDFRQEQIIAKWKESFTQSNRDFYTIYRFKVECSSGTYVREIANKFGEFLDTGAVCVDIHRTGFSLAPEPSHKAQR